MTIYHSLTLVPDSVSTSQTTTSINNPDGTVLPTMTRTPLPSPYSLELLGKDILLQIFDELRGYLLSVSTTSRSLRSLCIPLMFRRMRWGFLSHPGPSPPVTLLHHIQNLDFYRFWGEEYPGLSLCHALPQMARLTTIKIHEFEDGIPPYIFKAIFSVPTLESLDIIDSPFREVEPYDPESAPITVSLRHFAYHVASRYYKGIPSVELNLEATSLWNILLQVHLTIEYLLIPGDSAVFGKMSLVRWPHLREFNLYGLHPLTQTPMLSILAVMPHLESLYLELAQVSGEPCLRIIPPSLSSTSLSLSGLRSLTITYPSPDDQIFSRLPATLCHLSLRDCPRVYRRVFRSDRAPRLIHPLPDCQALLQILQASNLRSLQSLELTYEVDANETELLYHLGSAYPSLRRLELHRYRPLESDDDVPINVIANALSTCKSLALIHMYLDLARPPDPNTYDVNHQPSVELFRGYANIMADGLPALDEIGFLIPSYLNRWFTFVIKRETTGQIHVTQQAYNLMPNDTATIVYED